MTLVPVAIMCAQHLFVWQAFRRFSKDVAPHGGSFDRIAVANRGVDATEFVHFVVPTLSLSLFAIPVTALPSLPWSMVTAYTATWLHCLLSLLHC